MISFSRVFRGLALAVVCVCVAAVAVGRMASPDPTLRSSEPARYATLSTLSHEPNEHDLSVIDLKTGKGLIMDVSDGDRLSQVSWSPWLDETGRGQAVGFWMARDGWTEREVTSEIGLARYRFPDGEPLDRVVTDITPASPPCWYPGTRAQVLFADGGGTLHRFAFEGSRQAEAGDEGRDAQPSPIVWKIAPPGDDERTVRMMDPVWPEGRALGGRLIVSLTMQVNDGDFRRFSPPRLWWLKLDAAGQAIEAAGPLVGRDAPAMLQERCPRVVKTEAGEYRIAYLVRKPGANAWDVAVAPLEFDGEGLPFVRPDRESSQARVSAPIAPAFSLDGRWLYYLADPHDPESMRRVNVPLAFAEGETRS